MPSHEGTPDRVYFVELLIDEEIRAAVADRFELMRDVSANDPFYALKREIRVQRFLGYDFVRYGVDDVGIRITRQTAADTGGADSGRRPGLCERTPGADYHLGRVRGIPVARSRRN